MRAGRRLSGRIRADAPVGEPGSPVRQWARASQRSFGRRARARSARGQATIELVALLPVYIAVALAIGHLLAAGVARELAGHAAEAGAIAVLRGEDAKAAIRQALPEWSHDRVTVRVAGRRVWVRLEPPAVVPGAADLLAATGDADAGPAPTAAHRARTQAEGKSVASHRPAAETSAASSGRRRAPDGR